MKKLLLTTIHRPLGVESETCSKNISAEVYHSSITLAQGPFSIRVIATGWGLEFIAANLMNPTTVLHYPTKKAFIRELKKGYDYVGISFVLCTFPKAIELCQLVRRYAPDSQIILGGYGTVLKECDEFADYVCREEGVNYIRKLLGEEEVNSYTIPVIRRPTQIMSVPLKREAIIPVGLGCPRGCDFCCTSHFFEQEYHPLILTGEEIHKAICSIDFGESVSRHVGIVDEDFLIDKKKIMKMAELNAQEIEKPIFISPFASLKSISQYSIDELITVGLFGVLIGIESKQAKYPKLLGIDAVRMIAELRSVGISALTTMVIGYDWHNAEAIEEDFQYLLSLKPALTQFMIYSPCPQTPLYKRLKEENRLLDIPYKFQDGFHLLFRHPYFSPPELESLLQNLFMREYEELGPSIFRILEVQLEGYESLKENPRPLFRARAREHERICLEIYPLLKTGIKKAPSHRVKEYLKDLRDRVESRFSISMSEKIKECIVPALYIYTKLHSKFPFLQQPRTEVHRYNFE